VDEERAELVSDPEAAVGGAHERLRIEVEAGEDTGRRRFAADRRREGEHVEREVG
jgi:hypothetical protein